MGCAWRPGGLAGTTLVLTARQSPSTGSQGEADATLNPNGRERVVDSAQPASLETLAAYVAARAQRVGVSAIRQAAAAIGGVHRDAGRENPCRHPGVRRTLAGLTRQAAAGIASRARAVGCPCPACRPFAFRENRRSTVTQGVRVTRQGTRVSAGRRPGGRGRLLSES